MAEIRDSGKGSLDTGSFGQGVAGSLNLGQRCFPQSIRVNAFDFS